MQKRTEEEDQRAVQVTKTGDGYLQFGEVAFVMFHDGATFTASRRNAELWAKRRQVAIITKMGAAA